MSSEAAHFIVGATLALPAVRSRQLTAILPGWLIPISSGLLATLPDLDLAWKHIFGPARTDLLQHRGLFHSPFFIVFASGLLSAIVARRHCRSSFAWLWVLWAGCMLTHPVLDALTTGGRGIMLLLPFTRARLYFPWRPLSTALEGALIERAWYVRPSEIPLCIITTATGILGLLPQPRRSSPGDVGVRDRRPKATAPETR